MSEAKYEPAKYEPADIVIYLRDKGLVLKEKSLVAFHRGTGKIEAVGAEAERMAGNETGDILVMSPLRQGRIADYMVAEKMMERFMARAWGRRPLRKPVVAVCVPRGITEVEKKAVEDAVIQAGARELVIADIPAEQFVREFPLKFPQLYGKVKMVIGIGKDDPEAYVREELARVLEYAREEGICADRAGELFERAMADAKPTPS